MHRIIVLLFSALSALSAFATGAVAEYEIGVGDKIRVSVYGQKELSHSATVDLRGSIWLPMVGQLAVSRLTVDQLRGVINKRYSTDDRVRGEDINVEIIEYRPFYIDGSINRPGAYPFTAGLRVRQAIAIAGGLIRITDDHLRLLFPDDPRMGQLNLRSQLFHRQARASRLQAELEGMQRFEWNPSERLAVPSDIRMRLSETEDRQLQARRVHFEREKANAEELIALTQKEVDALEMQDNTLQKEADRSARALSELRNLKERGVISLDRIAATERDLFSTRYARDSTRSQLASARRQHKELIGKKEQLATLRHQELITELNSDLSEIDSLTSQLALAASKSQLTSSASAHLCNAYTDTEPVSIFRHEQGQTRRLKGDEDSVVYPGDTIKISMSNSANRALCLPASVNRK